MYPPATSVQVAQRVGQYRETETRLEGNWLALARLVCLGLSVASVGLYVLAILRVNTILHLPCMAPVAACASRGQLVPADVQRLHELGLSVDFYALYSIGVMTLSAVGYWLVAAVLFWRKSDDRLALLAALSLALFPIVFNDGLISRLTPPWWFLAHVLSVFGFFCAFLFWYVFPSGRFVPGFTRWVLPGALVYWGLDALFPSAAFNPFGRFPLLNSVFLLTLIVGVVAAQIFRYRRVSSPVQRQQTKWVVYGESVGWGGYVALLILSLVFPSLFPTVSVVSLIKLAAAYVLVLLPPLSIGFAIVRARLWEIDVVINRTLVYGILTVCIVGVYVLVVGTLGTLADTSGNLLISLVAAGLVAVLFQPLRGWLQRGVNRLLYGQRDEPYAVVTRLSQRLEGTFAPNAVLPAIVETVAQALKLPYAAILLKREGTYTLAASTGAPIGEPLILPLIYQSEASGQLHLAPRTPGETFTPADRRLLDELARQAGVAAHAVRLSADLQRSYEHLEQRVAERTRELSSLLDISHTVASTLQLKPLVGLILDQLKTVVDYTGASILTVEGENLVFLDHRGPIPQTQLGRLQFPLQQLGPIWQTIASGETLFIHSIHDETHLAQALRAAMGDLPQTTFHYVCSWMAVPLRLRDQVIGMLVVASDEENAFTPHHATLALAVANQAAIAIENARLYAQAQEWAALEERQKLARELHDSVSQALYGIALGLHTARIQLDRDPRALPDSLDYLLSLAEAALNEMRALIFELRPESLETEGLIAALAKQAAAAQARNDLRVQTDLCDEPALPLKAKQELYRIAQEAVQNAVKHARAHTVDLILQQTADMVILEVHDDGIGFDPLGAFPGHLGLRSMRERVGNLGGMLQIDSAPGQGAHLRAQVPAARSPGDDAATQ
ncbi:MAG TPA: GAF domain-containing sensor histidine kinase [Ktedonobacterales bacterium]